MRATAEGGLPVSRGMRNVLRADGERKRALIYDTALALFREKGFDATTMRDIAKSAGIRRANIEGRAVRRRMGFLSRRS